MKKAGKLGWTLILISGITFVIFDSALLSRMAPVAFLPLMLFLGLISISGMLAGQILVVWQNKSFFQQSIGVLLGIGLLILNIVIFTSGSLSAHNPKIIRVLYNLNLIWLVAYIITFGFILALHLYYNDRSVLVIGTTLLIYVWANLIYLTRVGPETFLTGVLSPDGPALLTALTCVTLWTIPVGLISFFLHSAKIIGREINPEYIDVQRKTG